MLGLPFIQDTFASVLKQSKIIGGRFYYCPQWAKELNNINIEDAFPNALPMADKYPCALLMPPIQRGHFQYVEQQSKDILEISVLFLTPALYTGQNAISQQSQSLASMHTVLQTQHDMARVAKDFLRILDQAIVKANYQNTIFLSDKSLQEMILVTNMGNDKVSGVLLRFPMQLSLTCEIEDYTDTVLDDIVLPLLTDSHPLHLDI